MDISSVASDVTAMQMAQTANTISVSMTRKSLDIQSQQGQALVNMMNSSAGIGNSVNTQG